MSLHCFGYNESSDVLQILRSLPFWRKCLCSHIFWRKCLCSWEHHSYTSVPSFPFINKPLASEIVLTNATESELSNKKPILLN